MQLPSPITLQRPPVPLPNGSAAVFEPEVVSAISVTLVDIPSKKTCIALLPHNARVVLWQEGAYDAAQGYTRDDAESRLLELLGPDVETAVNSLMYNIPRHAPGVPY